MWAVFCFRSQSVHSRWDELSSQNSKRSDWEWRLFSGASYFHKWANIAKLQRFNSNSSYQFLRTSWYLPPVGIFKTFLIKYDEFAEKWAWDQRTNADRVERTRWRRDTPSCWVKEIGRAKWEEIGIYDSQTSFDKSRSWTKELRLQEIQNSFE